MNTKWILSLFPISLLILALTASGQTSKLSNAIVNSGSQTGNASGTPMDTTAASFIPDSLTASLSNGWLKEPGQMPVYIPGLLPNSMPVLTPPPVDEEMIMYVGSAVSDSLNTTKQEDK